MKRSEACLWWVLGVWLAALSLPAQAAVQIVEMTPTPAAPQLIGQPIAWTVRATDSNPGPVMFQFKVARPGGPLAMVKDFNVGRLRSQVWKAQPFVWTPTGIEGMYGIQVVAKDFVSGESDTRMVSFQVNPLVTGSTPVAAATGNPLVALFSAPSCPAGSLMRVSFQPQSLPAPPMTTNFVACHPPATMTFEIAGMYANTSYEMFSQTETGGTITNGPAVTFTTGTLPQNIRFPRFPVNIPAGPGADLRERVVLSTFSQFGALPNFPDIATDLLGNILWFYYGPSPHLLTRPLPGGSMLHIETGQAWNRSYPALQLLRQVDLAGNIVRETNTGIIQQELLALGAVDGGPCDAIPQPAPVGAGCLGSFHHDAIQTLPHGYTAVIADIEKIFPPGTQGDTSGLPVDIVGDMIIVLDNNWQAVWYFDAFEHDGGAPQLDINRAAVLGDTCSINEQGCPPMFLLGTGIAPQAHDWLHANTLYYWPPDHDLIWSAKNQDWVMRIDYQDGAGTGNILWRMGPCGDFTFNNINNDAWPWFSAQHEVAFEDQGQGVLTLFDNGDTRVSLPGSSSGCMQGMGGGDSRGMALSVDQGTLQVTPVLSADLGVFSTAGGSAQLLFNGDYFFEIAAVLVSLTSEVSYSVEILPTPGTTTGTQVLNIQGPVGYRGWQMRSLYSPPLT
jgi:arylsulfate sulfotransferase